MKIKNILYNFLYTNNPYISYSVFLYKIAYNYNNYEFNLPHIVLIVKVAVARTFCALSVRCCPVFGCTLSWVSWGLAGIVS